MAAYWEIFCGIAAVLIALYYYFTAHFDFWTSRGVPGPKPIPVFGNVLATMIGKLSIPHLQQRLYTEYKDEPLVGIFIRRTPVLIVQDPEMIKDVLIKDFSKFVDRGFMKHEIAEPQSQHLFALESKRWRPLRTQLSPVFTSGKLRGTFSLILDCAEDLIKYLDTLVARGEPIECRELAAQYTTDVIGSCAFGVEMNSLSDKESEFRRIGRQIFASNLLKILRFRMKECCGWLYDSLGYILPCDKMYTFFTKLIFETMEYRKKHNIVRPDFINTLLELQKHPEKLGDVELTDSLLVAQAFVFFAAGFETSSTTISNVLYELALNQDVQDKLREEIKEYSTKNNGDWRYETIKDMIFLEKVFKETLRKYPPVPILTRDATDDYTFNGTKVFIPKKTKLWIPMYAIHWDPNVYPNPEKFDPERFDEEVAKTRHPMHHLPFGDGPRNCIGARFAVYQTKIGLIKMLLNYKFSVCEKTPIPYELNPVSFILTPTKGLYLKITKMES